MYIKRRKYNTQNLKTNLDLINKNCTYILLIHNAYMTYVNTQVYNIYIFNLVMYKCVIIYNNFD